MKPTQDEFNEFLDDLRESGVCNMITEVSTYVAEEYPQLDRKERTSMWSVWAKTFGDRHSND
jgi:hypothetical protein